MTTNRQLPYFQTYAECKRFVFNVRQNFHLRWGQAICNKFTVDEPLADQIYEEPEFELVAQRIWNFQFSQQNLQNQNNHHA